MTNDKNQNGRPNGVTIKSSKELDLMRESGQIVAETKILLAEAIQPGLTTAELDRIAENEIRKRGGVPSFKGYLGFPATICSSFNEEIVHGIPSNRCMNEGDLISIDIGAIVGGFHSDTAFTAGVGDITDKAQCLIEATEKALRLGIAQVKPGARIGDISSAIQEYSEGLGYGVVRQYVGHGIGRSLHEDPQVPNYGSPGKGPILRQGMTIAIEPMLNMGSWETETMSDGWTVVTADRQLSAHFEDTVAITNAGVEVFTSVNMVEAKV
ncbi:type I methionyl aminopeptidase [Dehalococcoidia bacterium]|jgi:methionyl aminopeptidase|nr:type I methionyl aminopeptidase [Dehalococcoidia bacterium]